MQHVPAAGQWHLAFTDRPTALTARCFEFAEVLVNGVADKFKPISFHTFKFFHLCCMTNLEQIMHSHALSLQLRCTIKVCPAQRALV